MRTLLAILVAAASLSACRDREPEATATATATASVAAIDTTPAAFFQCRSCHAIGPGENGLGPTLHGIIGSKAGAVPGFAFSPALAQSGIVWDRATLDQWLAGPSTMVPGTRMTVAVPDPVRRKAIIDYLETLE